MVVALTLRKDAGNLVVTFDNQTVKTTDFRSAARDFGSLSLNTGLLRQRTARNDIAQGWDYFNTVLAMRM